ncbi:MAG: cyclic nucleotide-binding domain-containing protein [Spirochaetales bacterium]|nr:cyclic nucleotide-binding domain-containing protein [Spirochaetales bacterium]
MADNNMLFNKYGITVDADKVIFREGEPGDKMYIIQEGSVRISRSIEGKEHILAVLSKGDFFGEMAIVNQEPRTATVTAGSTVRMLSFNREGFLGMIDKNGKIALNIIDKLCRRLNNANQQIQHLVKRNEKWLIASNLSFAFAQNSAGKPVEMVKLVRELSLNVEIPGDRIIDFFNTLKEKGVIAIESNLIVLKDKGALDAIVDGSARVL